MSLTLKSPAAPQTHDASTLRVAIVHARWNAVIVDQLVAGAQKQLRTLGVPDANIELVSVPGSWELPGAVQRLYAASQLQSASSAHGGGSNTSASADLLGPSASSTDLTRSSGTKGQPPSYQETQTRSSTSTSTSTPKTPFDAIIAVGVLIKGETMHFEYISSSVSEGLMRVQLDAGVPVVFGVLTVVEEKQAIARAGMGPALEKKRRNVGEEWAEVAVEMGARRRAWAEGRIV
ncbi:MAG: hypothetical protein M1833_003224 [Piccolia ochrophora]|nr:MAG: hypothetical protein M1833_003224 [Piccolia ochrophora]